MSQAHFGSRLKLKGQLIPIRFDSAHFNFDEGITGIQYGDLIMPNEDAVCTMVKGKFGGGVAVEEATTNLISNPGFEDGFWSGIWGTDRGERTLVEGWNGEGNACRITLTVESGSHGITTSNTMSLDSTKTYTISFMARASRDNLRLNYAYLMNSETGNESLLEFSPTISRQWKRYSFQYSPDNTSTEFRLMLAVMAGNDDGIILGDWFEFDDVQLEEKQFATSFVDGSRGRGLLYYKSSEIVNIDEGTVSLWIKPGDGYFENPYSRTFRISEDNSRNMIDLMRNNEDNRLLLQIYGDATGNYSNIVSNKEIVANKWQHICVSWAREEGKANIYIDGKLDVYDDSIPEINFPSSNKGYFSIGNGHSFTTIDRFSNSIFDEIRIDRHQVDSEEISSWYISEAPFYNPWDYRAHAY